MVVTHMLPEGPIFKQIKGQKRAHLGKIVDQVFQSRWPVESYFNENSPSVGPPSVNQSPVFLNKTFLDDSVFWRASIIFKIFFNSKSRGPPCPDFTALCDPCSNSWKVRTIISFFAMHRCNVTANSSMKKLSTNEKPRSELLTNKRLRAEEEERRIIVCCTSLMSYNLRYDCKLNIVFGLRFISYQQPGPGWGKLSRKWRWSPEIFKWDIGPNLD